MKKYTAILDGRRIANPDLVSENQYTKRSDLVKSLLKELYFTEDGDGTYINSKDSRLRVKLPYSTKLEIEYGDVKREVWFDDEEGSFRDYNFVNRFIKAIRECWEGE